jgi:hypothetical protein
LRVLPDSAFADIRDTHLSRFSYLDRAIR